MNVPSKQGECINYHKNRCHCSIDTKGNRASNCHFRKNPRHCDVAYCPCASYVSTELHFCHCSDSCWNAVGQSLPPTPVLQNYHQYGRTVLCFKSSINWVYQLYRCQQKVWESWIYMERIRYLEVTYFNAEGSVQLLELKAVIAVLQHWPEEDINNCLRPSVYSWGGSVNAQRIDWPCE